MRALWLSEKLSYDSYAPQKNRILNLVIVIMTVIMSLFFFKSIIYEDIDMSRWITFLLVSMLLLLSAVMISAQEANASVIDMANTLNVRSGPSGTEAIVGELTGNTPVNVIARTSTNRWFQITSLDGAVTGWVASDFIQLNVSRSSIPILGASEISTTSTSQSTSDTSTTTTTTTVVEAPAGAPVGDASVNVALANVRASSNTRSVIITDLPLGTVVSVIGRNSTSTWIRVQLADGQTGWIFARLLDLNVAMSSIPTSNATTTVITTTTSDDSTTASTDNTSTASVEITVPAGDAPYFTLGASAVNIFATGQELGNRANVFSKIGDSITVAEEMYRPFGFGVYNLGGYDYLQPTINFFMAQARNNNSFNNTSLAAGNGYTTETVLNAEFANPALCLTNESPLACEYRLTRPAVALIMLGSNDTHRVPIDEFAHNIRVIADYSIANGVIPVLSTIPPNPNLPGRAESYNQLIIDVAAARGLPLWDYYGVMVTLPDSGLGADGLHPSSPPLGFEQGADFRGNNLQYGYVMRNLTALQALHSLRVNVLQ